MLLVMHDDESPVDELLRACGVSRRQLGRLLVADERTLRRLSRGRPARPSTLARIAAHLGVPVDVVAQAVALARAQREAAP